ncbi:MAG: hemolysin family protein [Chloroflexota bacterium]
MSGIEVLYLVLIFVCLLLSAFLSMSETAFVSLQKMRLEHMVNSGVKGAKRVAALMERPEKLLSAVLTGNEVAQTAAAAMATALAVSIWEQTGVAIATVVVTILLLIFCDTTPKTIGIHHAERLSLALARPIQLLSWLLTPFVVALGWVASGLTKVVGGTPLPRSLVSEEEIRSMISAGHREGTIEEEAAEMLHNVFDFGDRPVREVMVPRPAVVFVEQGTKLADFLSLYAQNPLSRFPVYQDNRDNVVGILSVRDVLMAQAKGAIDSQTVIDGLVRPAYFAPETKPISELFVEMRDNNRRMTVVVDEFGGTAGVVSLSQLMQEIVGPVGDELAGVEKDYEIIDDYTFQIDGGMRIDEANEEMELELPEGDYETVAGFVLHLIGRIPKQGEQLRYKGLKLVITKMRGVKIEEVLVTKEKPVKESKEKDAAPAH